jgi:hypothetical protein
MTILLIELMKLIYLGEREGEGCGWGYVCGRLRVWPGRGGYIVRKVSLMLNGEESDIYINLLRLNNASHGPTVSIHMHSHCDEALQYYKTSIWDSR